MNKKVKLAVVENSNLKTKKYTVTIYDDKTKRVNFGSVKK